MNMTDKVILGEKAIFDTNCEITGLNNNVIVSGGSGCGKTMSVTEPRLLTTHNSSLIVTVTKRRIVDKYKKMFEERGYVCENLNFVNPSKSTVCYDPLQYVCSYSDITFLAQSIVKANPRKEFSSADPYWDDTAVSLLCAEIAYVLMTKDNATFSDVLELNDQMNYHESGSRLTTTLDEKFEIIERKDPHCFAINCWKTFQRLPIKTASCVFSALNTTIDNIFTPEIREMISSRNNVDFERLASEKTVLFVTTSAVNPSLNCFINMFYSQSFKQLFEFAEARPDGKLPVPVHLICDDFATGSKIMNFPEYISIFREKQISVTLLLQSESQLDRMYGPDDATTIINNCDTYMYMGGMDLKTCRSVCERANVPLDEVLYMPIGKEIIFRRGSRPVFTQRYDILKDPVYCKITGQYNASSENLVPSMSA